MKPDAIIVADLGVLALANKLKSRSASGGSQEANKLEIHLSTQANATNSEAIKQYAKFGVKRVILPREISIDNIKRIRKVLPKKIELEAFRAVGRVFHGKADSALPALQGRGVLEIIQEQSRTA